MPQIFPKFRRDALQINPLLEQSKEFKFRVASLKTMIWYRLSTLNFNKEILEC